MDNNSTGPPTILEQVLNKPIPSPESLDRLDQLERQIWEAAKKIVDYDCCNPEFAAQFMGDSAMLERFERLAEHTTHWAQCLFEGRLAVSKEPITDKITYEISVQVQTFMHSLWESLAHRTYVARRSISPMPGVEFDRRYRLFIDMRRSNLLIRAIESCCEQERVKRDAAPHSASTEDQIPPEADSQMLDRPALYADWKKRHPERGAQKEVLVKKHGLYDGDIRNWRNRKKFGDDNKWAKTLVAILKQ